MQVAPIKPTLKAPGTERLTLKNDKLLSNFGFTFNSRRYTKVDAFLDRAQRFLTAEVGAADDVMLATSSSTIKPSLRFRNRRV